MRSRAESECCAASRRQCLTWLAGAALVLAIQPGRAIAQTGEDPARPPTAMPRLFGSAETTVGRPQSIIPKSRVLDRAFLGQTPSLVGASAEAGQLRWETLMIQLPAEPPETRIAAIDRFVNDFAWVDDDALYQREDYWATPEEFLSAEAGDCEDFAIAKYVALARVGFDETRLRVALVFDQRRRLQHALTIVYWGGDALVLDSLADAPRSHLDVTRYRPICSFNRQQLWVHRPA